MPRSNRATRVCMLHCTFSVRNRTRRRGSHSDVGVMGDFPWRARRSVPFRLTCISHHVGKRSAEQGRQDEVRTALAGNTALGVFSRNTSHESRLLRFYGRQTFLVERTRLPPKVFTKHESRDTKHGFFSKHVLYGPSVRRGCAVRRKSGIEGGRTKKPKSDAHPAVPAITSRLACPPLDAIGWLFCCPVTASPAAVSHYSPLFPVISRGLGGLRRRCSSAVRWKSRKSVQNPASPRKMRETQRPPPLPSPSGLVPFASNGNPCRDRGTIYVAKIGSYSA